MVRLAIGTEKGGFVLRSTDRRQWSPGTPFFPGWKVTAFGRLAEGTILAGTASSWFGAAVNRSSDLESWEQVEDGPAYGADSGRKLKQIWTFHVLDGGNVLTGVDEAGLFRSTDAGVTWEAVNGLNDHGSRSVWSPGAGGLCAHRILSHDSRLWVGISAVGVFRSEDGGASFTRHDAGVTPVETEAEGAKADGWCVHGLVADPTDPDRIWRQDHMGVYQSMDGGDRWERIEEGLPSGFGFAIARDHGTGRLFVAPVDKPENRVPVDGRLRVFASDDSGASWQESGAGWPEDPSFGIVLRGAIATDELAPCGVYVGTTSGEVWGSSDAGETWARLPGTYPRILALAAIPD